jgi:putative Mg2+ transporter-C (MgtC) family protein
VLSEDEVRRLIGGRGFSMVHLSSRLLDEGRLFEYRMVLRSRTPDKTRTLAEHHVKLAEVTELRISPTRD